jgi:hypothetical protein
LPGECCPGEKMCAGEGCIADRFCCSDERHCEDGSCIPDDQCCPEQRRCPSGACLRLDFCCGGEKECADGSCIPDDQCCSDDPDPHCGACPNGSPDDCSVYYGDHCATHPSYFCMRGVAGNSECVQALYPYQVNCQADADCDWIWGPGVGMCGLCRHQCYHKYLE